MRSWNGKPGQVIPYMGNAVGNASVPWRRGYTPSAGIPHFVLKCKLDDHVDLDWKAALAKQFWGEPTDNLSEWKELWLEEYYR